MFGTDKKTEEAIRPEEVRSLANYYVKIGSEILGPYQASNAYFQNGYLHLVDDRPDLELDVAIFRKDVVERIEVRNRGSVR